MDEPTELTTDECVDLLRANVVGRVALSTPVGPRIILLNYAVHDDSIVFRTAPYSQLASYGNGSDLAFEVDHVDYETHQGWSVVAVGRGSRVDDPEEIQEIRATGGPRPWVGGSRGLHLRLRWRELSGRRLGDDWTRASLTPVRRTV
jgi:nitroimidazol reductase NimA-like FMN-containing flavoprotein (pyridoxamine 5'-phosphate oxidase superfamily)